MRCPLCYFEPGCRQLGRCCLCFGATTSTSYWYCHACSLGAGCCEVCGQPFHEADEYLPLLDQQRRRWIQQVQPSELLLDAVDDMDRAARTRLRERTGLHRALAGVAGWTTAARSLLGRGLLYFARYQ